MTRTRRDGPVGRDATVEEPEQLSLLPAPAAPLQFRLDEATRQRGLRHIAEIRARLEHRAA
jgi:hypothetical protein